MVLASYRERLSPEDLRRRAGQLRELMRDCVICPRECHAKRLEGRYGVCRSTAELMISSAAPHFGEEPPLVGRRGSGTVFITSCNLKCMFCQNYDVSHMRYGRRITPSQLAEIMLGLERGGCHNINFVTPTHMTAQIVEAVAMAAERGLSVPLVYNCGGYESTQTLKLIEDVVDIYMPDIKYGDNEIARRYSGATSYWNVVRPAISEMHRQVGDLSLDEGGVARRGLLIRHLVLPNRLAGSRAVLDFIARNVSVDSYVNIMDQYRPAYRAIRYSELSRGITMKEYDEALEYAHRLGLHRGFEWRDHVRN
jgi:putative pyruvate formate lyase activating enzyme